MKRLLQQAVAALALIVTVACSAADKAGVIEQTELLSRIEDKTAPVILDVRSEAEYKSGHVPGAINVPYPDYQQPLDALSLKKGQEIIIYCESGRRAGKVEKAMKEMGFFEIRHLEGDMRGWREADLATEQ